MEIKGFWNGKFICYVFEILVVSWIMVVMWENGMVYFVVYDYLKINYFVW